MTMQSFSDIIAAFGGPVPFREAIGISDVHSRQMKARDSIPPGYWPRVVDAARGRRIKGVTLQKLAALAEHKLQDATKCRPASRERPQ